MLWYAVTSGFVPISGTNATTLILQIIFFLWKCSWKCFKPLWNKRERRLSPLLVPGTCCSFTWFGDQVERCAWKFVPWQHSSHNSLRNSWTEYFQLNDIFGHWAQQMTVVTHFIFKEKLTFFQKSFTRYRLGRNKLNRWKCSESHNLKWKMKNWF